MNILIVSQYFWPESFRINDLALGLKERGHIVTVLTGIPNYPTGTYFNGYRSFAKYEETYESIRILRAPIVPRGNGRSLRLILNYLSFSISASIVSFIHNIGKQDVILVYEPSPITVGIPAIVNKHLYSAPILFWVQDLWPETLEAVDAIKSKSILSFVEKLVQFIYKRCDMILVQSQAFTESVQKHCTPAAKVEYFPNSTEAYYQPVVLENNAPEKLLVPSGFIVMFAGNIGVAQDFPTILDAAELTRHIAAIKWVIIGDGRQKEWLTEEINRRSLGDSVHLLGRHPAEQMPRFFSMADALLVTLKRDPIFALTIPSKVQSYLACARPIVAALDGEGARIVDESGAGVSCPAESPQALADAVISLYGTPPDDRDKMGRRGREYYEKHFDRDMLIGRLEEWMKELVKERQT